MLLRNLVEVEKKKENPPDVIRMDVPLFIRMLEFGREDAASDLDLHDVAEKAISLSAKGRTLTMEDYDSLVPKKEEKK